MVDHRLRDVRLERGLSQEALGAAMGVNRTYVSLIESKKRQGPVSFWVRAAAVLGVSLDDILSPPDI
jgi:transcriptional regulator with XRE-family HTH domain